MCILFSIATPQIWNPLDVPVTSTWAEYLSDVFLQRTWTIFIIFCLLQSMTTKGILKYTRLDVSIHIVAGHLLPVPSGCICIQPCMCAHISVIYLWKIYHISVKKIKVYNSIYRVISFKKNKHVFMCIEKKCDLAILISPVLRSLRGDHHYF